jgi:hypothetical protein
MGTRQSPASEVEPSVQQSTPSKPPGPVLLILTVTAVLVWICLRVNFWPSPFGQFAWLEPFLAGLVVLLIFLALGLVWAYRTLRVVGRDRRWSWWILSAPLIVLAGAVVLHFVLPTTTFLDKRSEFDTVAQELRAIPGGSVRDEIEIGPFDIRYARATADGDVYFHDTHGSGFNTQTGWVYSPDGPPTGFDDFTATHLDGPWYEFEAFWRD